MRYAKITRDGSHCIMPLEMAIEEAKLTHSEGETGEKFEWENVDMAEEEYAKLPEFAGW